MRYLVITAALAGMLAGCDKPDAPKAPDAKPEAPAEVAAPFRTYTAEELFKSTAVVAAAPAGFAFSPDGSKVLMTSDESGAFSVYAVDIASGTQERLTTPEGNSHFADSYFPADGRILFHADKGGDELDHIWVREEDGSVKDLTATENTKASFGGWSADGSAFYVLTNERDPKAFDLYRYAASDYARTLVFQNDDALDVSAMSRDGRWLAFTRPRTSADSDILVADLTAEKPELKLISEHEGNISYGVYAFTPDSAKLIYATDEHGEWNEAWSYDLATGEKAPYIAADWDVSFVDFSATGAYRYSGINEDAVTRVTVENIATGEKIALSGLPAGDLASVRFSKDDSRIAFMVDSAKSPRDLYVADLATGEAKVLTHAMNPAVDPSHLVEPTVVRYASFDGTEIPSILYKPQQASAENKVPAIVFVHGGPGGQTRVGYSGMIQHLVNHGYAVLGANNRGSSGYGKSFFHMDDKRHGEGDLQDIVWGRKYLESLDWVDGDRVAIVGGSYGGFMVAAALAFEPDAFDAGINIFGVTNWVRTLKSIPPWWESFKEALYDEMGDPATDEERHRRISPLFHAANITKPLLVVQGANDPRVLQVESDELVAAVRANGVPVDYLLFPDEGHGFLRKENRVAASERYVTFLDQYLKGKEAAAE
ncbi:S9 family peptidase [Gimibacter soli]|uniref:S9 family peptidase n=1 Tax=Gimibacter soli TaxID=3024400 RepID=A0AAF0BKD3_9PROT|nr:S9 family peptidase [Gimibacter soli]WCL52832.1 S9 family peptidase [Gimibacter soli]